MVSFISFRKFFKIILVGRIGMAEAEKAFLDGWPCSRLKLITTFVHFFITLSTKVRTTLDMAIVTCIRLKVKLIMKLSFSN